MNLFEHIDKLNDFMVYYLNKIISKFLFFVFIYSDETATEWTINEAANHRERTLKYKVPYESTFVGKGTIYTREKQVRI